MLDTAKVGCEQKSIRTAEKVSEYGKMSTCQYGFFFNILSTKYGFGTGTGRTGAVFSPNLATFGSSTYWLGLKKSMRLVIE